MATVLESQIDYAHFQPTPNLVLKVQELLRKLWLFHIFQHSTRLITVDVPFQLLSTPDGRKLAVLLNKAYLPRRYPLGRLIESGGVLEDNLGVQAEIRQEGEWIVICLDGKEVSCSGVKSPLNGYIGGSNEYKT